MKTTKRSFNPIVVTLILIMMAACGGTLGSTATTIMPTSTPLNVAINGDPIEGRAIFTGEKQIYAFVPCSTCHYLKTHRYPLLGPDMAGISKRAATRVPGMSAVEYLRKSIRNPDDHVLENYPASTMNPGYAERLSDQEVEDVIAFLMTL